VICQACFLIFRCGTVLPCADADGYLRLDLASSESGTKLMRERTQQNRYTKSESESKREDTKRDGRTSWFETGEALAGQSMVDNSWIEQY
jgi:hypothetical protein